MVNKSWPGSGQALGKCVWTQTTWRIGNFRIKIMFIPTSKLITKWSGKTGY